MGQVTISVNGRSYRMSCRDGEEKRVTELAAFIEGHVNDIRGGLKFVQEERLYLMAALMVADQLFEAREELQRTLRQLADLRFSPAGQHAPAESPPPQATVERLNPKSLRSAGNS